jgi:hypothetical protein
VRTWPDTEGALKTFLAADSPITALVSSRVFFGMPTNAGDSDFPMITLQRVGGGEGAGDAPVDEALIQVDCWGPVRDKATAWSVVSAVRDRLTQRGDVALNASVRAGLVVQSVVWLPDPDNARARYSITAEVTAWSIA